MAKCATCSHENPPRRIFCENCQNKIARVEQAPPPSAGDIELLKENIQALKQKLLSAEAEIKRLDEELKSATAERDELALKHPEVESLLRQLEEKDQALESALEKLDQLHRKLPDLAPEPVVAEPYLLLATHPIANPAMNIKFTQQQDALDLSATDFLIRAHLERAADSTVQLVVNPGATVNVKTSPEKHWRRMEAGSRIAVEPGMILFDPKGAVNARFDSIS